MRHKLLKIVLSMLISMAASIASAYDAEINGIYYNFSGNEAEITAQGEMSVDSLHAA